MLGRFFQFYVSYGSVDNGRRRQGRLDAILQEEWALASASIDVGVERKYGLA